MGERSGGSAGNGFGEPSGAAFGSDDAMRAGGESGANDGPKVVRIFDAIEENNEADLAFIVIGTSEDIFERGRSAGSGEGDYALMIAGIGKAIELAAFFEAHRNAVLLGELNDFFDARILTAFGDHDAVEGAACFEGFADGMNAGETVHEGSVQNQSRAAQNSMMRVRADFTE